MNIQPSLSVAESWRAYTLPFPYCWVMCLQMFVVMKKGAGLAWLLWCQHLGVWGRRMSNFTQAWATQWEPVSGQPNNRQSRSDEESYQTLTLKDSLPQTQQKVGIKSAKCLLAVDEPVFGAWLLLSDTLIWGGMTYSFKFSHLLVTKMIEEFS